MDKITYLAQLAEGLARWVPERERQDILRYYAEYFEEAGPQREAEVVAELGDPWALSSRLAVEGGYVSWEQANAWTPPRKKRRVWPFVLAGSLAAVVIVAVSVGVLALRVGGWIGRQVFHGFGFGDAVSVVEESETATAAPDSGTFYSVEDGNLDEFTEIKVDVGLGNVSILVGDDYSVDLLDDQGAYFQMEEKKGVLKITGTGGAEGLFGATSAEVVITVPEEVCLRSVSVTTGLGNVFLSDFAAEEARVESGLGYVECEEARISKLLELESGMGDVTLWASEPALEMALESGTGKIEINLDCAERQCEYELETGIGAVEVNGRSLGSEAESRSGDRVYKLKASSGVGSIYVEFYGE